ncbi:MAG: hypothetical protein MR902_00180 [Campylobacter sp.]|nr:hypothetical protein [Campylobacter sp.]
MENEKVLDKFELDMVEKTKYLQECQASKNLKSCFECDKLLNCQIRTDYVDSVYNSMSKGQGGDFNF